MLFVSALASCGYLSEQHWAGLQNLVNFSAVPVDLGIFKTMLDAYSVSIGEAKDGGKKAITLRNKQGEEVIRLLRARVCRTQLQG